MWWIIFAIILLTYFAFNKRNKYWQDKRIPYLKSWPVLGEFAGIVFRITSFWDHVQKMYGKMGNKRYIGIYQFTSPTIIVKDPELIKQITVKDFDNFMDHRPIITKENDSLFGRNLLALTGQEWREMRTTLSPSFTGSKMRAMFGLITECSDKLVNHYLQRNANATVVEMKDMMTKYANDVIATCAFGLECNSTANPKNEFYVFGKKTMDFGGLNALKLFGYTFSPFFMKFFNIQLITKQAADFFRKIITDTINMREKEGIIRPDMIHLLMEARKGRLHHDESGENADTNFALTSATESLEKEGKYAKHELTDDDMVAQAIAFFGAGFDTTSTLMSFVAYELAVNPFIQEKLQREIDTTLQECDGKITYNSLSNMKYLDMVVSEALRKWPPFPITDRLCLKNYVIPAETSKEHTVEIEKGVIMMIPIFALHRDPQYYPEPEKFDPERFSPERKHKINPFTYLPFGAGPRNCIGMRFALMETKAVLVALLSKYDITPNEKTQIPIKISKAHITLNSERGIWVTLRKRNLN